MELDWRAVKPISVIFAIILCLMLIFQGISASAGISENEVKIGTPHAVTGYVYWPNGTLEDSIAIPVSITNNRTGETGVVLVDILTGGNPNGTYQVDLAYDVFYPSGYISIDTIYVNCTYMNMWAHNETTVGALAFSICDLHLVELPLGPELVNSAIGSSITGFDGNVTIDIPPGALASDTVIFGVDTASSKPGSFASINLRPDGTTFSPPATLKWSYDGLDIGDINPLALTIYTYDGEFWIELPSTVDVQAKLVIAEVSHFSLFSMGSATLTGAQVGLSHTYPGTLNVPILDLAITNTDGAVADTLDYIHVVSNCTDDLDIVGVSLWNDSNDNAAIDGADVQLGITQPFVGGNTNFTAIAETIPAITTLNVLVCLDVSGTATIGNYLDLLIPMNAVGLANAGLNLEAIDPSGNTTINQELTDPHAVYGYVSNLFGPLPDSWVNLTNNRTGAVEDLMTDSLGRYEVNLGLMPGGYLDTDEIYIVANDTLGQTGWNNTFVDMAMFGEKCDIYVANPPYASNETPMNGSVITNLLQNVTINITTTGSLLNNNTIILEVDGVNYTWPDPVLSYAANTLTFNTSLAVGSWTSGQTINVTLWTANDTIGNPCLNAPYSWVFFVMVDPVTEAPDIRVHKDVNDINITWMAVTNATEYVIYRSLEVNGTGFNWLIPLGNTTETYYVDIGALADGNNYSYVVRGLNGAGEGPKSNIGWKLSVFLQNNIATTSNNWVALPYFSDISDAASLMADIGASCTKVSSMNLNTQYLDNYVGIPIQNFALQAGLGYQVVVNADVTYTMVGSYDPSVTIGLQFNAGTTSNNWIALPYHANITDSSGLMSSIGPTCTKVSKMNLDTQYLTSYVGIPIQNFILEAGLGNQVVVTSNSIWIPPIRGY